MANTVLLKMACTLFRMTPAETFAGVTRTAAAAVGLGAARGTIEAGKIADLVLWDAEYPAELSTQVGLARPQRIWIDGTDQQESPT